MNKISDSKEYKEKLLNRFTDYVQIWSESNGEAADKGIFPSTIQQFDFAKKLQQELNKIGMEDVQITPDCYVYARKSASKGMENIDSVLLMAHMDTVDEVSGKNVKPVLTKKDDDIIISSDETTLLGADDKAGISAIMTAAEYLNENPKLPHCAFEIMFSPDEETGHGMDKVPLNLIKSKCAYTVDGGDLGELETECFNAWSGTIEFTGKATHTGTAKAEKMINAAVMASNFIANLPRHMAPETTSGHEGFIAVMSINGGIETATVELLLRSFNIEEIEQEKQIILENAKAVELSFGGKTKVTFQQQYLNMKEKLEQNPDVIKRISDAFIEAGVTIVNSPIRGGTDGSRLTEMGIPTPNIFTGGHNFHSRTEWCSLNQMSKASDILVNLLIKK